MQQSVRIPGRTLVEIGGRFFVSVFAGSLLGLSGGATAQLTTLQKGEAIWKVGDHLTRVYHLRSKIEEAICDTDQRL